jgi:hypothetical protein
VLFRKSNKNKQAAPEVASGSVVAIPANLAELTSTAPGVVPNVAEYRRPKADVYTVLLVMALVAILVAILFLCLEMKPYKAGYKGAPPVSMIESPEAIFSRSVALTDGEWAVGGVERASQVG